MHNNDEDKATNGNATNYILLNCLDWQHEHLTTSLSVLSTMEAYPNVAARQEQITWHIQAALRGIEALRSEARASAEPVQEQQDVLLRAATDTQETPPEQSVRASAGTEQP